MKRVLWLYVIIVCFTFLSGSTWATNIHHDLRVVVNPDSHSIKVIDTITIPEDFKKERIHFILHRDLDLVKSNNVRSYTDDYNNLKKDDFLNVDELILSEKVPTAVYIIRTNLDKAGPETVTIRYKGSINHPVKQMAEEYARSFSQTPGIIDKQGVYLAGSSYWVPWFGDVLMTFTLDVNVPVDWDVVSQGSRKMKTAEAEYHHLVWNAENPTEEVYLIAGPFVYYEKKSGPVTVMAYLRSPDDHLAEKYINTTSQYLAMYQKLIGTFPYTKFALVENFWETGYGMPSFTLLGPQVIRFPFILHSSYPHELLHNWWGNSVYVDWSTGNWCEGITVYMADHLIKEQRGQGEEYRQTTLQKFTHYVNPDNDFPIRDFLSRDSAASEAIGYGKSMMIWHMLRQKYGDETFIRAIQQFYQDNRWEIASFDDLKTAFETVTGDDLGTFFKQWIDRKGAPQLELSSVFTKQDGDVFQLHFTLKQIQEEGPFTIEVPVGCHCHDEPEALLDAVEMTTRQQSFQLDLKCRPVWLDVDPRFDLFRRLHRNEVPPSLSQAFGATILSMVLPFEGDPQFDAYKQLSEIWSENRTNTMTVIEADKTTKIPETEAVWILGQNNPLKELCLRGLEQYGIILTDDTIQFDRNTVPYSNHSIIMTVRHPDNPKQVLIWFTTDNENSITGLSRKLPHYGKYSYLTFEGDEPTNIVKGRWPAVDSPLSAKVLQNDGCEITSHKAKIPKDKALAMLPPVFSEKIMLEHIRFLSSNKLEGRGYGEPGCDKAAEYIAGQFKKAGLKPGGDNGSYFQTWIDTAGPDNKSVTVKNVIGVIQGRNTEWQDQSVILCAHYDHLGRGWPDVHKGDEGKIHPGADDNASGVSVLLEVARHFQNAPPPDRTLIFIAFTGEESGRRGSKYYLDHTRDYPVDSIFGAVNLDSVGRLNQQKLLVLGASSAHEWKHIIMGCSYVTGVPSQVVTQDLDSSDQVSFIERGIPAVQLLSGPHEDYHRPSDTIDKIDPKGLIQVADFTREVLVYLSQRETPMTVEISKKASSSPHSGHETGARAVRTGTMPDFTYTGIGYRIGDVSPDSAAERAGLQKGDVIIKLDQTPITNLKDFSTALKSHLPGDVVALTFMRNTRKMSVNLELEPR